MPDLISYTYILLIAATLLILPTVIATDKTHGKLQGLARTCGAAMLASLTAWGLVFVYLLLMLILGKNIDDAATVMTVLISTLVWLAGFAPMLTVYINAKVKEIRKLRDKQNA